MTKKEWANYLLANGEVKVKKPAINTYVVKFKNEYYVVKDNEVVYTSIYLATAKRFITA